MIVLCHQFDMTINKISYLVLVNMMILTVTKALFLLLLCRMASLCDTINGIYQMLTSAESISP